MPAELYLKTVQGAVESVFGTAVPATRILYGMETSFSDPRASELYEVDLGRRDNNLDVLLGPSLAAGSMTMRLSADELPEFLEIAIKGGIVPSIPGGGTLTRDWDYVPGALNSATLQWFDGMRAWILSGARINTLRFAGDVSGQNTVEAEIMAANLVAGSLTGALTHRSPTQIRGYEGAAAIDNLGGTPGTTDQPYTVVNYSVEFTNRMERVFAMANTQAAAAVTAGTIGLTAQLTVRAALALSLTEFNNWLSGQGRIVVLTLGNNVVIEGALKKHVKLFLPMKWTAVDLGQSGSGERLYQLSGNYVYSASDAYGFKVQVRNARAAAAIWTAA